VIAIKEIVWKGKWERLQRQGLKKLLEPVREKKLPAIIVSTTSSSKWCSGSECEQKRLYYKVAGLHSGTLYGNGSGKVWKCRG